jgi:hypothetical protein
MLDEISRVLDDRSDKLGVLDSFLMDDRLTRKTIPTTMPVAMGYYSSNYGYRPGSPSPAARRSIRAST